MATRDEIMEALGRVIDPELRRPVTELKMIRAVEIDGADVSVTIALTVVGCPLRSSFEDQVAEHVGTLPSVASVTLKFDVMSPDEKAFPVQSTRARVRMGKRRGSPSGITTTTSGWTTSAKPASSSRAW